jgi:hypothetical protein
MEETLRKRIADLEADHLLLEDRLRRVSEENENNKSLVRSREKDLIIMTGKHDRAQAQSDANYKKVQDLIETKRRLIVEVQEERNRTTELRLKIQSTESQMAILRQASHDKERIISLYEERFPTRDGKRPRLD